MHHQRMDSPDLPPVDQPEKSVSTGREIAKFLAICLASFGVISAMTFLGVVLFLSFAAP